MGYFLPFYPPNSLKNINFKTMKKKTWRYYHFTLAYKKSWLYPILFLKMAHDGCNCCFLFGAISSPFTSLTVQKVKISKKWIKRLEILSFYTSVPKIMIICYTVLEIWHMAHVIVVFHFGLFFFLLPPNSPKKQNSKKMKKIFGEIIILHMCTKNYD